VTKAFGKQYLVSLINTFGSTDSPPAWQLFANVVWWLFQTAPEAALRLLEIMLFYVDNFWGFLPLDVLGPCPEEKALEINSAVHDLLDRLNLPFHEDFCGQFFEGLGSAFGTVPAPFISFKPGKRTLALAFMDWLPRQQSLSLKDLQRAKGFFTWIAATLPVLRPFIAQVQALENAASRSRRPMMPTAEFKRALNIMKRIMLLFPEGHRFVLHRGYLPTAAPDLVLRTDAS
jgi:hypothetical protein